MTFTFPRRVLTAVTYQEAAFLNTLAKGKVVLELGSQYGASAIVMSQTAKRVFAVDWHRGDAQAGEKDTLRVFLQNLRVHTTVGSVIPIIGRFEDVLPYLAPGSFDLAFIDGYHTYEAVQHDLGMVLPLLKRPGDVAFHDYERFDGVTRTVRELAAMEPLSRVQSVETVAAVTVNRTYGGA